MVRLHMQKKNNFVNLITERMNKRIKFESQTTKPEFLAKRK